jgi:hypothetical protein
VSRRGPSPAQKKQARKADRAEARARETAEWDEHMVLEPAELRALLRHLDAELNDVPCDHTLRLTLAWAKAHGKDPDRLLPSLNHFGGVCDHEVVANVDPETRVDTWARY